MAVHAPHPVAKPATIIVRNSTKRPQAIRSDNDSITIAPKSTVKIHAKFLEGARKAKAIQLLHQVIASDSE